MPISSSWSDVMKRLQSLILVSRSLLHPLIPYNHMIVNWLHPTRWPISGKDNSQYLYSTILLRSNFETYSNDARFTLKHTETACTKKSHESIILFLEKGYLSSLYIVCQERCCCLWCAVVLQLLSFAYSIAVYVQFKRHTIWLVPLWCCILYGQ